MPSKKYVEHLDQVCKDIKSKVDGPAKKQKFQDSVETARKAGVDEDKILKNKKETDDYFTS